MSDATKWSDFDKMIQMLVRDALNELGEMVNDKVKANIDEHVYVGSNEYYLNGSGQPSYEFRESYESTDVSVSPNNPEVLIKSNPEKMKYDGKSAKHGTNHDIREYLPEILAFNMSGDLFGANKWWHNRSSFHDETIKQLSSSGWLNKTFKQLLRKRGLTVV